MFQNIFWYKRGRLYLSVRQLLPLRLADPDGVQHTGELEPVLGTVDELRWSSQDAALLAVQWHGDVVGQLASHREDHSLWVLSLVDIHHHLIYSK